MAQKVVFSEAPASNVVPLPLPGISAQSVIGANKKAIAQAKANYNYPWWHRKTRWKCFGAIERDGSNCAAG